MEKVYGIGILLDYHDRASAKMLKTQSIFHQTKQTAEDLTKAVDANNAKFGRLAKIAGGVSVFGYSIKKAGDKVNEAIGRATEEAKSYQTELNRLKFMSQATGKELEFLNKTALETGMATSFSPQETVQGMYQLISAGMDTRDMLVALRPTLDLVTASAGKINLAQGTALMASTLKKFNLEASESVRVADMLSHATRISNFQFEDLAGFMNSLGSAPSKMKRPMEELIAMGALLRNVGQQGPQAGHTVAGFGRSLMIMTNQLERGKARGGKLEAMKAIGLDRDTLWNTKGELRSMVDIFDSLVRSTAGMTHEKKASYFQRIFGDQASNMLYAVEDAQKAFLKYDEATGKYVETTKDGKKSLSEMVRELKNAEGSAKEGAEAFLNTAEGVEVLREGSRQTFQVLLGQTLLPVISKFHRALTKVLNKIIEFGYKHPTFMKALGYGVGLAGLFLTVAGVTIIATGALMGFYASVGMLTGGIAKFAVNNRGLSASMLHGKKVLESFTQKLRPFRSNLLSIAAIAGMLHFAWKYDFAGVQTVVRNFVTNTRGAFTDANNIVNMNTTDMIKSTKRLQGKNDFFSGLTLSLVKLKTIWKGVTEAWNNDYVLSEDTFKRAEALGVLPFIEKILDLKMIAEAVWEGFIEGFKGVGEVVKTVVKGIIGAIKDFIKWIGNILPENSKLRTEIEKLTNSSKDLKLDKWKTFGKVLGTIAGIVATIKITKMILSPINKAGKLLKDLGGKGVLKFVAMGGKLKGGISKISSLVLKTGGILKTAFSGIGGFLLSPLGKVTLVIAGITLAVIFLAKNWDKVTEAVKKFKDKSSKLIDTFVKDAKEWFKGLVDSIKEFFAPLVEFFKGIGLMIAGVFQIAWSIVSGLAKIAFYIVKGIWLGIVDFFTWIWGGVKSVIESVWDGILSFIEWVVETVKVIWTPISEFFSSLWEVIKLYAKYAWSQILLVIQTVKDIAIAIWTPISEFFSMLWSGIVSTAQTIWNGFVTFISYVVGLFKMVWTPIVGFFSFLWNTVKSVAVSVWNNILSFITLVVNRVKSVWNTFIGFFTGLWNRAKAIVVAFGTTISGIVRGVVNTIASIWSTLVGKFDKVWGSIKSSAKAVFDWLASKFEWVTKTAEAVKGAVGGIKEGVSAGKEKVKSGWNKAKKVVGLSTGGYVKTEGMAMLHPNEVVVNDDLTRKLRAFLHLQEVQANNPPVIRLQQPEPKVITQDEPKDRKKHDDLRIIERVTNNPNPTNLGNSQGETNIDNSVTFEEGAIKIIANNSSEEEAERLAKLVMEKIEKKKRLEDMRNYRPIKL